MGTQVLVIARRWNSFFDAFSDAFRLSVVLRMSRWFLKDLRGVGWPLGSGILSPFHAEYAGV